MDRRERAVLLALLLTAFLAVAFLPVSIGVMDELAYIRAAQAFARGEVPEDCGFYAHRVGLVLPMALAYRILGDGEPVYRYVPMLAYLGSIWVAYHLARRAASGRAGPIAAALAALYPAAYWQSTVPNTDAVLAFWLSLAFWAFLAARDREDPRAALRGALAGGAFLGAAYLTKTMALAALLPLGLLIVRRPRGRPLAIGLATGLVAVLAAETLFSWLVWGEPLARWSVLARTHFTREPIGERLVSYPRLLFDPLDFRNAWVGLHYVLAFAAAGWAALRRERRILPFAIWLVILFLILAYGSVSLRTWKPIVNTHPRFLAWIAMPAHVLGAWLIARALARPGWRRRIAIAGLAAVAAHSLLLCAILRRDAALPFAGLRRGIRWLADRPLPAAIYTDGVSAKALTAILGREPGFAIRDYLDVGDWRGKRGLIFDDEALRDHPMVLGRRLDPASTGARLLARFRRRPPWRLRSLFGRAASGESEVPLLAIWELPGGA